LSKKTVQLNDQQKAVVGFRQGYAVAMASPGSGKTACIVERVLALLREGVKPSEILSLTFTSSAAKEMVERAGLKDVKEKIFSTFHSWALGFIKRECLALPFKVRHDAHGPNPLCLPIDAARMLAMICRHLPDKVQWKDAQGYISLMKRRGISPAMAVKFIEHDGDEKFVAAYAKYEQALREKGVMDFDSVVIETARLLESRADVRARNRYKFVQIDEAHDTDSCQWECVKHISENILAVGDENQGIYGWRGSESKITSYFCGMFPAACVLDLPINYRSTKEIVAYCKEIAPEQNSTVLNFSTPNEQGVPPTFRLYGREDEEAAGVIRNCQDLGNTAILARTNRQLACFENECATRGLRYRLLGKSGYWNQREVKDCIAIVGAVVKPTDNAILGMLKSRCEMTKFLRKSDTAEHKSVATQLTEMQAREVGKTCLSQLLCRLEATANIGHALRELRSELRTLNGLTAIKMVLNRFGVLSSYDEDDNKDENVDNDPRDNVMKLVEYAGKKASLAEFYEWTGKVQRSLRARTDCLTLGTIHASKGREWKYVFVVGVNQDVLPHVKGEIEEEKRIFFVACSRAALKLHVSASGVASELMRHKLPKDDDGGIIDAWDGFELLREG